MAAAPSNPPQPTRACRQRAAWRGIDRRAPAQCRRSPMASESMSASRHQTGSWERSSYSSLALVLIDEIASCIPQPPREDVQQREKQNGREAEHGVSVRSARPGPGQAHPVFDSATRRGAARGIGLRIARKRQPQRDHHCKQQGRADQLCAAAEAASQDRTPVRRALQNAARQGDRVARGAINLSLLGRASCARRGLAVKRPKAAQNPRSSRARSLLAAGAVDGRPGPTPEAARGAGLRQPAQRGITGSGERCARNRKRAGPSTGAPGSACAWGTPARGGAAEARARTAPPISASEMRGGEARTRGAGRGLPPHRIVRPPARRAQLPAVMTRKPRRSRVALRRHLEPRAPFARRQVISAQNTSALPRGMRAMADRRGR